MSLFQPLNLKWLYFFRFCSCAQNALSGKNKIKKKSWWRRATKSRLVFFTSLLTEKILLFFVHPESPLSSYITYFKSFGHSCRNERNTATLSFKAEKGTFSGAGRKLFFPLKK
jgi:hypothetical protein